MFNFYAYLEAHILCFCRFKRSIVCWCWTSNAYFEARVLLILGFWFLGDIKGQMCVDLEFFNAHFESQVLYFWEFCIFESTRGQMCVDVKLLIYWIPSALFARVLYFFKGVGGLHMSICWVLMHIWKPKCFIYVWIWVLKGVGCQMYLLTLLE